MFINIFWMALSILIAIALICVLAILVIFTVLLVDMDRQDVKKPNVEKDVRFDGPSRWEMEMTTARLLREDKRRPRKRHAQVIR